MDVDRQKTFLESLALYSAECDKLPNFEWVASEGYGIGYGEVEAHFLHCVIRHFRPRKIMEVGSGVSTYFALNALGMNHQSEGIESSMVCIEPYPRPKLRGLAAEKIITIHEKQVQDVDPHLFEQLEAQDILFVDSSHTSKTDSDVNFLYFQVLPRLKKGVVVHIHDIPFPHLTCPPDHPVFDHSLLWNEAALLRAFLMWNGVFEILMCQSFLHYKCPESIKRIVTAYGRQKHFPSSLWMIKTG
jgi:predicted O-methyltransferase YrrM